MTEARTSTPPPATRPREEDQRVYLRGLSWEDFEAIVRIRGEVPVPRIHFLDGVLELMTPSWNHEWIKATLGRLLEAWSEERGPDLQGVGSWLLKESKTVSGVEPDECYIIGDVSPHERDGPDIGIEVIWTHGGLDKLEIYRRYRVREVWFWEDGRISVHRLKDDASGYDAVSGSELLPDVDLALLGELAGQSGSQTERIKALRAWLRGEGSRPGTASG